jgi:four helix bundle protein
MEQFKFEGLLVYQKSLDYIDFVHTLTPQFPAYEQRELGSQFRRASSSVSLNIGEGEGGTTKEYLSFLRIARRSVRECVVCTTVAHRRKYINDSSMLQSRAKAIEISRMLSGLMASIKRTVEEKKNKK